MANPIPHESLSSWLKFFDVDYLDDQTCAAIARLDPNDPGDVRQLVQIAVRAELGAWNAISSKSVKWVLHEAVLADEEDLGQVFGRVSMPFEDTLQSRSSFLQMLWGAIYDEPV